eukprot:TRINITY_DN3988_c0_g1_i2.p5 TRINITY_DN3988_c0_g1~~TRINITY_DN3988_c0_g1_i2.p5  ORF type:complete len:106 (-),score=27.23 TRINITY_DN3988_c0_g1_i2:361-678(-)
MGSLMPGSVEDHKSQQCPEDFVDKKEEQLGEEAKKAHTGDHIPWWIKGTKDEKKILDMDHKLHEEQEKKDEHLPTHHHDQKHSDDGKHDKKIESEHNYVPKTGAE